MLGAIIFQSLGQRIVVRHTATYPREIPRRYPARHIRIKRFFHFFNPHHLMASFPVPQENIRGIPKIADRNCRDSSPCRCCFHVL